MICINLMSEKLRSTLRSRRWYESNKEISAKRATNWQKLNRPKCRASQKKWRKSNTEKVRLTQRDARLKMKYGISLEEFNLMLKKQENKCAACGASDVGKNGWHLDHNHANGKVRGILCGGCNVALGMVRDSVAILQNLIAYIGRSQ